ncbi:MAG TPA: RdgB/HAM1 family non-canonical purine NTP pyrophosphatase [Gammaproteobacteria bacterium]|nr:RdgB/HAM1 family non-canonical purine NTP pyrophosphatase [Gammaproteobacteria bacterium]
MSHKNPPPVVLASNNPGKLQEFREILGDIHISIIPQSDLGVPEVEETGLTFVENALLKARNAAKHTGLPALADDSGLEVDILNGAPGIYSARYAGAKVDFSENRQKLLSDLIAAAEDERTARFQCVLALLKHDHDPSPLICQGTWEGKVLFAPRGENGFGYDSLFFVPTHGCSAAELPSAVKNQISHRAKAIAHLIQELRNKL